MRTPAPQEVLDPALGGALIEAIGSPSFGPLMLSGAQKFASIDEIFAYRVARDGAPEILVSWSDLSDPAERATLYASAFHRDDPATPTRLATRAGACFALRVGVSEIGRSDYRLACFERPRFVEKNCYGWRRNDEWLVLSFYRRRADDMSTDVQLAALANLGLSLLGSRTRERQAPTQDLVTRIEERMSLRLPGLSSRERQVCARTLAGWTAKRIAGAMGIQPSTVLTYRQRAYQRLGASKANDMLTELFR